MGDVRTFAQGSELQTDSKARGRVALSQRSWVRYAATLINIRSADTGSSAENI